MNKDILILLLIPIIVIVGATVWLSYALTPIQETIIERLHTPVNNPLLPDRYNDDLTCHKVGLYTNWDERWTGKLSGYLTGIYAGEHARQMFFSYGCICDESIHGADYWQSNKMCLRELYPHEG